MVVPDGAYSGLSDLAWSLQWHHNGHDGVSNHQSHHCLLNRLFGRRSKKTSKLRVTGLCVGNSSGIGEFPAQRASNAENVSIWWRHHGEKGDMVNNDISFDRFSVYNDMLPCCLALCADEITCATKNWTCAVLFWKIPLCCDYWMRRKEMVNLCFRDHQLVSSKQVSGTKLIWIIEEARCRHNGINFYNYEDKTIVICDAIICKTNTTNK